MRKTLIFGALSLMAVPSVAVAQDSTPNPKSPAAQCRALQASMGEAGFKQEFGTNADKSNAFGKCVSRQARQSNANTANAARQCRAERADANFAATHGGQTFAQFYGTNANDRNAFGRCVSTKARAKTAEQQAEQVESARSAARACRAERGDANFAATHGGKTFAQFYGTNANGRNAFGKCVSRKARA
jgi:hypothetical protein